MALDYFQVECTEKKGRKAYEEIAGDILMDFTRQLKQRKTFMLKTSLRP